MRYIAALPNFSLDIQDRQFPLAAKALTRADANHARCCTKPPLQGVIKMAGTEVRSRGLTHSALLLGRLDPLQDFPHDPQIPALPASRDLQLLDCLRDRCGGLFGNGDAVGQVI